MGDIMYRSKVVLLVVAILSSLVVVSWSRSGQAGAAKIGSQAIPACTPGVVNYDLVYVRAPRYGDNTNTVWPDTVRPLVPDPGAQLMLLHPNCTEELLFPRPEHQPIVDGPIANGSVSAPNLSFDGVWVVFAYYHDQTDVNPQRCSGYGDDAACLSHLGADIYRINLNSRQVVRLTAQEFTPNTGNGADFDCGQPYTNCPLVGVFNVNPAFVAKTDPSRPGLIFVSSRNNFLPPRAFNGAERALQLFTMDWDGQNVTQIGYLNNAQALHPVQLMDGRVLFTSWEEQGVRDMRIFPLWVIAPDGTGWMSFSGFGEQAIGHHFTTQMSNGDIVTTRYYNLNNNGFGGLARYPLDPAGPDFLPIHEPNTYMPFQRPGQIDLGHWSLLEWELANDFPAPCTPNVPIYPPENCPNGNGSRVGKASLPATAPNGNLLLTYTPGAANHNGSYTDFNQPYYDGGLYLMPAAIAATGSDTPADLVEIVNNPAYNEQWPRPVLPYSAIYGLEQPAVWPDYVNMGQHGLPIGSPLGLIGSSSLIYRDTDPRPGIYGGDPDPFNESHEVLYAWLAQGADAGLYSADDIYAIRLLALLPSTDRTYPNSGFNFYNVGTERIRILGEIPVRHEAFINPNGDVDTSFLAQIPADVPFTFQTLDRNGMVLNMAQTWHQLRPGEARYDCGGCHAHSREPIPFEQTFAGQPGYVPTNLATQTPLLQVNELYGNPTVTTLPQTQVTYDYVNDIQPILQNRCSGCHQSDNSDGNLNLHDDQNNISCETGQWPGTYYRLVIDNNQDGCPQFGLGTPTGTPDYFLLPQLTRYIRAFQSRESTLVWRVFGARLDGRQNGTRDGDIDYDPAGDAIHPQLDVLRGLTWNEKLTIARWVDIGAPIELDSFWGWNEDDLRPTLWVAPTPAQACFGSTSQMTVGAYDLESGLATNSLSLVFDIAIGGVPAGTNLAAGYNPTNGGVLTIPLPASVNLVAAQATLTAIIRDPAGHTTTVTYNYGQCNTPFEPTDYIYLPAILRP